MSLPRGGPRVRFRACSTLSSPWTRPRLETRPEVRGVMRKIARARGFHSHALPERISPVLRPADDRPDDPSLARRLAHGLEHLHGVFPGDASGRVCLLPSGDDLAGRAPARRSSMRYWSCFRPSCFRSAFPSMPYDRCLPRRTRPGGCCGLLLVVVGLPFFVVSTSAPLLQRWFSQTGHPDASDPYFLVRREQPRKHACPSRVPCGDRDESRPQPAAHRLGRRVWVARRPHPGLRRASGRGTPEPSQSQVVRSRPQRSTHFAWARCWLDCPGVRPVEPASSWRRCSAMVSWSCAGRVASI